MATHAAARVGTITRKMTVAEPKSPAPKTARSISMKLAPTKVAVAPTAVATEFMVATWSRGTTWGSAAERPDVTNRVTPLTISAPSSSTTSSALKASSIPTRATSRTRIRLAQINTVRRSQRSSSAPAKGPIAEYGRNSTANAPAMAHGSASRSGLNSNAPASPAWKRPSLNWVSSRTQTSRPKSGRSWIACHRLSGEWRAVM